MSTIFFSIIIFLTPGSLLAKSKIQKQNMRSTYGTRRIVGGTVTTIEKHPFQVSLRSTMRTPDNSPVHYCGAAIIHDMWVITAGHCVSQIIRETGSSLYFPPCTFEIMAGSDNISGPGQYRKVQKIILHPNYTATYVTNDVALLKVSEAFQFNEKVRPIDLPPSKHVVRSGTVAIMTGSGFRKRRKPSSKCPFGAYFKGAADPECELVDRSSLSASLQQVAAPVISRRECVDRYGLGGANTNILCTDTTSGGTCQGDSGGPLVSADLLIGVTSWGSGCGYRGYPAVFTRVSSYRRWISEVTDGDLVYRKPAAKRDTCTHRHTGPIHSYS